MSGQPPPPPPLQRLLDELSRNGENLHTLFAPPFAPSFAPPFASQFASPFAAFPLPYFPFAMDSQENEEEQIRKALEASVVERGVEVDHESYAKALEESSKEYQAHLDQSGKAEETTGASSPDGNPLSTPTVLDAASNDSEDESLIQYAIALSQGLAVDDSEQPSSTTTAEQQLSQQLPSSSSSSDASPSSPSSHPPPSSLTRSPEPIRSTASAPPASSRPPSTSPVPVDSKELERQRTVFEQNLEFQRTLEIDRARLETGRLIEQAQQERQSQLDAITASTFPEEPPASAETCTIAVRLPNSSRIMRTWSLDTELDIVVRWVSSKLIATGKLLLPTEFILATGFPNARKLIDNAPLRELNIGNRILLSVDLCND